eukprot:2955612-Amphidinium_carterae.1
MIPGSQDSVRDSRSSSVVNMSSRSVAVLLWGYKSHRLLSDRACHVCFTSGVWKQSGVSFEVLVLGMCGGTAQARRFQDLIESLG